MANGGITRWLGPKHVRPFSTLLKGNITSHFSDRYAYTPLDESAKEIRIVTLLPGKSTSVANIYLDTETLDPASNQLPSYEALSYTWGSSKNSKEVLIRDRQEHREPKNLRVTQNLAAALFHLRHEHEPRRFWIDAICVDQQNLHERSSQVQRMGDIYKLADRVVVWLGPEENGSSIAMGLLENLASMIEVDLLTGYMEPSAVAIDEPEWANLRTPLPWTKQEWKAVLNFLFRSWFERIWIQQEIRLGDKSKSVIQCGFEQMQWSALRSTIVCLHCKPKPDDLLSGKFADYELRVKLIMELGDEGLSSNFFQLLHSTKNCKCSDPRDRVYSLLGLSPYFDQKPVPDYKKSVSEVYEEMVLKYERSFSDVNILTTFEMPYQNSCVTACRRGISSLLGYIPILQNYRPQFSMPSWARYLPSADMPELLRHSWAAANSSSWVEHKEAGVLKVAGVHLQETIRITKTFSPISAKYPLRELVPQLYELAKESDVQHGGCTSIDMFCRTLATNGFSDLYYPPATVLPDLENSKILLSTLLGYSHNRPFNEETLDHCRKGFVDMIWTYANSRSFFFTTTGKIGLAPQSTKPGDQIVVFLGCRSPMLLRPVSREKFQLVGEVFFNDACFGQSFLGPIPEGHGYRSCMQYDEAGNALGWVPSIINCSTLERLPDDPRLGPLPPEWKLSMGGSSSQPLFLKADEMTEEGDFSSTYSDPRLTPEALKKRGVAIRYFELV
ncbi:heterokaryon incompatibility protein-domain-containing protein [Bisporella sp. PMI_857]|nr:heterokaryon incompatibility protein-domain-containing protein [Bisporella sp. PMI_857]